MTLERKNTPTLRRILLEHVNGKYSNVVAGKKKAKQIVEKIAKEVAIEKMVEYLKENLKLINKDLASGAQLDRELKQQEDLDSLLLTYQQCESEVEQLKEETQEKKLHDVPEYRQAVEKFEEIRNKIHKVSEAICNVDFALDMSWFEVVDKLCTADIESTGVQSSILDRPIITNIEVPKDPAEKERKHFLKDKLSENLEDYLYTKPKEGGGNSAGPFGGQYICCYESTEGEVDVQRFLIKQDHDEHNNARPEKDMIEYLSGRVMNALIGGSAATINLVNAPSEWPSVGSSNQNRTYNASVYFGGGFNEFYEFLYHDDKRVPLKHRPRGVGLDGRFAQLVSKARYLRHHVINAEFTKMFKAFLREKKKNFTHFNETFAARLLVGDFDCHTGNVGIINKNEFCAFDFGGVKFLSDDVHMHSHRRHIFWGFEPTNHFKEYNRSTKINLDFAAELERQAKVDLSDTINQCFVKIGKYSVGSIKITANRLGFKLYGENKEALLDDFKKAYKKKMSARQLSLSKLALEIRLSCYAGKPDKREKLIDLIKNNPNYFINEEFHFRDEEQVIKILGSTVTQPTWSKLGSRWGKRRELLEQINATVQKDTGINIDLKIKDIALRAEVYIARLKILADFISDQEEKKKMLAQVQVFEEWLEKYKSCVVILGDEATASKSNVVFLCDEAYRILRNALEKLNDVKLKERMEIAQQKQFNNLDTSADQQRYVEAFKRIALTKEVDLNPDAKKEKQASACDYVYNKKPTLFNHYDPTAHQRDEALLAIMIATKTLLDSVSSLIIALTALQTALEQQYGIKPVSAPTVPVLRS